MFTRWLSLLALLGLAGCSDDTKQPWKPTDLQILRDAIQPFLGTCQKDSECISAHCIDLGGVKRCSRMCDNASPCPGLLGWSCNPTSFCECVATGKKPQQCGVDGDCDGRPDKTPSAEVCNGEDDDCNGLIDDVKPNTPGAKLYYRDADGDGYGDAQNVRWLCKPEAGWVEQGGDCDDSRKEIRPGAVELCGDDLDNNCDGLTDEASLCGLVPVQVPDINDPAYPSGTLKACGTTSGLDTALDITEIVAKQDKNAIKFTVRLAGSPALTSCASYTLQLGNDPLQDFEIVYVYRPAGGSACGTLPETVAYNKGKPFSSALVTAFNAASPGHVSFTVPKTEFFLLMTTPTYHLKACTNAKADAVGDLSACSADSCLTPVRR
jgi:hypothetical protein